MNVTTPADTNEQLIDHSELSAYRCTVSNGAGQTMEVIVHAQHDLHAQLIAKERARAAGWDRRIVLSAKASARVATGRDRLPDDHWCACGRRSLHHGGLCRSCGRQQGGAA